MTPEEVQKALERIKNATPKLSGKLQDRTTPEWRALSAKIKSYPKPRSILLEMGEALLPEHLRGCLLSDRFKETTDANN